MRLKLLFAFLLLMLLQTNGFGAIITVVTDKNWSVIGSTSTDSIIVEKDDALANDTANANRTSPSILPPSACPAYTASISTTSSVCNTAPPPSVSLNVKIAGGQSPYSVKFRNEITLVITTVTNYTSGSSINISVPAVTTPYTLLEVKDANACTATITQAYTSILLYSIPADPTATIVDVACSSGAIGSITMNNAYQPGSLKFNGVNTNSGSTSPIDSHVDFGTTLLSNKTQFTGEGWIKFDKTKYKNRMSLFGQNDVVEFGFEADNLRCWTANGGTIDYPLASYPGDNAWHHIALVANGTTLQFYIDGISVRTGGSAPTGGNYGSSAYTTKIGWGVMDEGGVGLVGEVFNLSFWSRALSSDEIVGLATGFTQYNSNQVGLLAGYSFNEGSGTTMSSVGSVAPTGTLKGATRPVWTDPSTYSWTSTPPGFTSSLKNLTGLSPKTYNLAINLKGCPKTTSFVVNATNVAPTITTSATPAIVTAVCYDNNSPQSTTMAYTATTGTPTSYSIAWTGIANQSSTPFSFASGGGTVTGIIVPKKTANGPYSGIMTITNANGCTATQSISLVVGSVTPTTPAATPATNVGCSGFTANWNPVAGATGYYLDVSPDSNFGNFNLGGFQDKDVTLATSFVVTGLTTPGQTYYYRVRAYNKCVGTLIGGYSNKVSILVSVAVTNSILTQTICSGDSSAAVVLTSGVAGTTFDWTASAPSGVTGFTASGTGATSLPVQAITNSGTAPGTVTYSITPKANGCTGTAVNYTIVVNPTAKVSNTPLTQTICSGSSSTLVTLTSATAGTTFTWTATATSGVSGFASSGTNTIPALNISTTGTVQGTVTYVITPTANGCPGTLSNYTILVNPTPTVSNVPLTQTICSGGNSTLVNLTSGVTGTTFAWTASATAGVSGFTTSGTAAIPAETISTTGTTQGTVTYVITPTANGCPGTATNYTVLINPRPIVSAGSQVCIGSTITLSPTTGGAWASSNANATVTNAGVVKGVTAGTATFTFTNTTTGCSATTSSVTINALPTVSAGSQVCIGSTITLSPTTGGTWTSSNANATVTNAGVVKGVTAGTATFTFTNTTTGCSATTSSITINAIPTTPTVGTITLPNCITATGSVALSGLPFPGTLSQIGTVVNSYATTGTAMTISGLAVGTYSFTVPNGTCTSTPTGAISINDSASKTWNGGTNDWNTPSNWTPIGVPSAADCVIIASTLKNPVILGTNASFLANMLTVNTGASLTVNSTNVLTVTNAVIVQSGGALTFENNASLVQVNENPTINSGSITYKRNSQPMNNFDFTYWSSPVNGTQTLHDLSPNTFYDKYWKFDSDKWATIMNGNGVMETARGYAIRVPKPLASPGYPNGEIVPTTPYTQQLSFIGVPNNGVINLPLQAVGSYNLIGNPYPSALDADEFITANLSRLEGTMYFWTHTTPIANNSYAGISDYAVYNKTGPVGVGGGAKPKGNIASGQAFFMSSTGSGNAVFNNSMRVVAANSNAQFYRGSKSKTTVTDKSRVWLDLTNSDGLFKQMLVGYIDGATNGRDNGYDGESFDSNKYVDFYSVNNAQNFTIQGRSVPFVATDEVPLGYKTTIEGTFTITLNEADGVLKNRSIFVEDKTTKTIHNLKNGPYSFTTVKGTFNDRFVLIYVDKSIVVPPVVIEPPVVEPPVVVVPPVVVTPPVVEPPVVVVPPVVVTPPTEVPPVVVVDPTLESPEIVIKGRPLVVSVNNHQIKINSFDEIIANVMVYDLRGRLLYEKSDINTNEFMIQDLKSSDQFLIVITQLVNGKWVTKEIVFKN